MKYLYDLRGVLCAITISVVFLLHWKTKQVPTLLAGSLFDNNFPAQIDSLVHRRQKLDRLLRRIDQIRVEQLPTLSAIHAHKAEEMNDDLLQSLRKTVQNELSRFDVQHTSALSDKGTQSLNDASERAPQSLNNGDNNLNALSSEYHLRERISPNLDIDVEKPEGAQMEKNHMIGDKEYLEGAELNPSAASKRKGQDDRVYMNQDAKRRGKTRSARDGSLEQDGVEHRANVPAELTQHIVSENFQGKNPSPEQSKVGFQPKNLMKMAREVSRDEAARKARIQSLDQIFNVEQKEQGKIFKSTNKETSEKHNLEKYTDNLNNMGIEQEERQSQIEETKHMARDEARAKAAEQEHMEALKGEGPLEEAVQRMMD